MNVKTLKVCIIIWIVFLLISAAFLYYKSTTETIVFFFAMLTQGVIWVCAVMIIEEIQKQNTVSIEDLNKIQNRLGKII